MHFKSTHELSLDIRSKRISPVEVTEHMLTRIVQIDADSHSYQEVVGERARKQAKVAEKQIMAGQWRGPLHGVPLGIKDIFYTNFANTRAGTAVHKDFRPTFNATVVDRLELHGAITLGKLTTTEQAFASHHPSAKTSVNPWGAEYFCGSSSGATANGLAFGTLGSDTGGSIRVPCAANGITGLKPTWGRVSRYGAFALAETLDHVGPMTRSAVDAAIMLSAMAGQDPKAPTFLRAAVPDYLSECSPGIQGVRVGLPHSYATEDVHPDVVKAWQATALTFVILGAETKAFTFPQWDEAVASWPTLCSVEAAWAHRMHHPSRKDEYGAALSGFIEQGQRADPLEFAGANIHRQAFKGAVKAIFDEIDLYLIPVFSSQLLKQDEWEKNAEAEFSTCLRFTIPTDLTGEPTITFPVGFDSNSMPIAMQLCGPALSEAMLLKVAFAFQRITDWHLRSPI